MPGHFPAFAGHLERNRAEAKSLPASPPHYLISLPRLDGRHFDAIAGRRPFHTIAHRAPRRHYARREERYLPSSHSSIPRHYDAGHFPRAGRFRHECPVPENYTYTSEIYHMPHFGLGRLSSYILELPQPPASHAERRSVPSTISLFPMPPRFFQFPPRLHARRHRRRDWALREDRPWLRAALLTSRGVHLSTRRSLMKYFAISVIYHERFIYAT